MSGERVFKPVPYVNALCVDKPPARGYNFR